RGEPQSGRYREEIQKKRKRRERGGRGGVCSDWSRLYVGTMARRTGCRKNEGAKRCAGRRLLVRGNVEDAPAGRWRREKGPCHRQPTQFRSTKRRTEGKPGRRGGMRSRWK